MCNGTDLRWVCPECGHVLTTEDWPYATLARCGPPVCLCDADMELRKVANTPKLEN
jgi:hypothetical protein